MKHIVMASALLLTCSLSSCLIQKKKNVDMSEISKKEMIKANFNRLSLSGDYELVYHQGDSCSLDIRGPKDLVDRVEVKNEEGTLSLSQKRRNISFTMGKKKRVVVTVTSPSLAQVQIAGACDFSAPDQVAVGIMDFDLSGAGTVGFKHLQCDTLLVNMSGASNLDLDLHHVSYTDINLSGAGNADVHFNDCGLAVCTMAGAGNIDVSGDVVKLIENKHGVASINKNNLTIKEK